VEGLVKVYPAGATALAGLSFVVERGEIFGFLGPNGSGKTTATRILVTLLGKSSGQARVGGFDTEREPARVRELIGYAGQAIGIDDDLTVHENLALPVLLRHARPADNRQWADAVVEALALGEVLGQRAGRLSGGMRRRVDLAQALVHRPSIVFLDEPTTGLDPQSRSAVWDYLRRVSGAGTTIFLTTQYLEEADRACDRVAIIDEGRLVKLGTPRALKEEVGEGRLILTLADEADRARAARLLAASPAVARTDPGEPHRPLIAHVRDVAASLPAVIRQFDDQGIGVVAIEQARATLEDVFLRNTRTQPHADAPAPSAPSTIFAAAHGGRRRR
jgi:ABC-type multidrug transport system ATPase subunit